MEKKAINLVDDDGNTISKNDTSAHINKFFAEIGPKLARTHQADFVFNGTRCDNDMPDLEFTDDEIIKCVRDLDVSKSSAIEYLPTCIFKQAVLHKPSRFIKIINLSVSTSTIPDSWKIATVTPLP